MAQTPSLESPSEDDQTIVLSSELARFRARRVQRYAAVHVLLLTWKDTDLDIADEVCQLEGVFRGTFNYVVSHYQIPSQKSQNRLASKVLQLIQDLGENVANLIIVYYGGHGGPSKGADCVWSASISGEPSLDWSIIQPLFIGAGCDVAIFLDCCFAGQAIRSRCSHSVEFLAATDKDQFTPTGQKLGRPSFTKVLCNQLTKMLHDEGSVTIPGLHSRMLNLELGLVRQPFYVTLSKDHSAGRIRLSKWDEALDLSSEVPQSSSRSPGSRSGSLLLRLSLFSPLDVGDRHILSVWLTRDSPLAIRDIQVVDQAVSQLEAFQKIGNVTSTTQNPTSDSASLLLSDRAHHEAMNLLGAIKDTLFIPESQQTQGVDTAEVISNITRKSDDLVTFLADCLSSLEPDSLNTIKASSLYHNIDLASRISLRLSLLTEDVDDDTCKVSFSDRGQRGQHFRLGKQVDNTVLVEYWHYEPSANQEYSRISRQVARTSVLLGEEKSSAFRILPGRGYLHETLHGHRFGLVYKLPSDRSEPAFTTLAKYMVQKKQVALELRYRLARCLCEAVLHLHSIGWYHKAIKAENIVLLVKNSTSSDAIGHQEYDIEQPYLVGFDCSRPSDAETWSAEDYNADNNIYRHPDRWGRPATFERHHDIYALGTLLLEIGLWRPITSFDGKNKGIPRSNPKKLRDFYLESLCPRLAHAAGSRFAGAVETCLKPRNWKDYEDWQAQRCVRRQVWQPLCRDP